jgi:predicted aspartyl protease
MHAEKPVPSAPIPLAELAVSRMPDPPEVHLLRRLLAALCLLIALPAFAARCQLELIAEWPVRLAHNRPVIDGSINGTPVDVLIDTGASRTAIARSAAERLKLDTVHTGMYFYGVGGRTRVDMTEIEDFRLGQATLKNWRVLVAGEQPMGGVALILGEDYFVNLDVELDFGNKVMRLFRPQDCDTASLAYWAPDTAPLKMESPRAVTVRAEVGDSAVDALLDTGASRSTIDLKVARRIGITPTSAGVTSGGCFIGIGSKRVDGFIAPIARFTIGNEIIRDARIAMTDLAGRRIPGETGIHNTNIGALEMILGVDFLLAHRVFVSHAQRAVYITHNGRSPVFDNQPAPTCTERAGGATDAPAGTR